MLVAAEPREFDGLLPFCSGVRKLAWPVYWVRSAECAGRQLWMVANGAGAAHAARAVEVACPACRPEAMVSMGFCGALDPALEIGDVFVATAVDAAGVVTTAWARVTGKPPRAPLDAVRMARKKMFVSHAKAARELGFAPGPAEGALRRAVEWFRANGYC